VALKWFSFLLSFSFFLLFFCISLPLSPFEFPFQTLNASFLLDPASPFPKCTAPIACQTFPLEEELLQQTGLPFSFLPPPDLLPSPPRLPGPFRSLPRMLPCFCLKNFYSVFAFVSIPLLPLLLGSSALPASLFTLSPHSPLRHGLVDCPSRKAFRFSRRFITLSLNVINRAPHCFF